MRVYSSNERPLLKIATQNSNFENLNSESSESRMPQVSRLRLSKGAFLKCARPHNDRVDCLSPFDAHPTASLIWLLYPTASCDCFMRLLHATASPHLTACFIRLPHPTVSFKRPHPFRLIVGQLTNC